MKTLTFFKVGFIGLSIALVGGLSGCVQQTVVKSHHSAYPYNDRLLISSNIAYYERYGYPAGYVRPYSNSYYQPKTVVVHKVKPKVVHVRPTIRSPYNAYHRDGRDNKMYHKPVYSRVPGLEKRSHDNRYDNRRVHNSYNDKRSKQPYQSNRNRQDNPYNKMPVKRYEKPRPVMNKKPQPSSHSQPNRGLVATAQQAKRNHQIADNRSKPSSRLLNERGDRSKHTKKER